MQSQHCTCSISLHTLAIHAERCCVYIRIYDASLHKYMFAQMWYCVCCPIFCPRLLLGLCPALPHPVLPCHKCPHHLKRCSLQPDVSKSRVQEQLVESTMHLLLLSSAGWLLSAQWHRPRYLLSYSAPMQLSVHLSQSVTFLLLQSADPALCSCSTLCRISY